MILPGSDISGLLLFFLLEGLLAPFFDPLIRSVATLALYVTLADRAALTFGLCSSASQEVVCHGRSDSQQGPWAFRIGSRHPRFCCIQEDESGLPW